MADPISDERLRKIIEGTYCGFDEGAAIAAKLLAAQGHRDRLAATLVDVQRELLAARAEVERLRADLLEALRLLGQVNEGDMPKDLLSTFRWLDARDALLAKHKETNQ